MAGWGGSRDGDTARCEPVIRGGGGVRGSFAAWVLSLAGLFIAAESVATEAVAAAGGVDPAGPALEISLLPPTVAAHDATAVTSGLLDSHFGGFTGYRATAHAETLWFRLRVSSSFNPAGQLPILIARGGWFEQIEAFGAGPGAAQPLQHITDLREFGGAHDSVFAIPGGLSAGQSIYLRVATQEDGADSLRFSVQTLGATLDRAAAHSRMIALAVGALTAMALGSLLIWFILKDRLFLLYPGMFLLEALYLVYFSGEGFDWPLLSAGRSVAAFTWNVPVALSGAVACLFIREIADLRHTSPRVYNIFGWFAWAFVILTFSNVLHLAGWGGFIAAVGNLMFVGSAVFTLVVAFLAWRRGNRAAGWFLVAWTMLETVTITTAIRLLLDRAEHAEGLLYYVLPFS